MCDQLIYISLTSIFQNQSILKETLESILTQTQQPDKIFLYLSELPYLQDKGFKNMIITNNDLLNLLNRNKNLIEISWVENEGPYRKLLPLLKKKWNEDCIIITIDDDTVYNSNLIKNLVNDYKTHNCVINYRGFTPKCAELIDFKYEERDDMKKMNLYNFPTGKGGILYKPMFFHSTNDLIFNKEIYLKFCKTGDDIWCYIMRIKNNISCYIDTLPYMKKDNTNKYALCFNYNDSKHNNTMFSETLKNITLKWA